MSKQPPGRAPARIYWVELMTIGKLKHRQKGGGKYTSWLAAEHQQFALANQGIESELFYADLAWKKVSE